MSDNGRHFEELKSQSQEFRDRLEQLKNSRCVLSPEIVNRIRKIHEEFNGGRSQRVVNENVR